MKKLFVVLLSLFLSFSLLFASGAKEESVKNEGKLGDEPVTITFWHSASDEAGVLMDKFINSFNETNPYKITVKGVYQGQYSDATTLMKTIISAENYKELPDVMQMDATGKVDYFSSGRAFTASDAFRDYEDISSLYIPIALSNWEYQGVNLGLPFALSTTITFYNVDMLKAAGWDKAPDTFKDIIELKKDLEKAGIEAASYGTVPNTPLLANWLGQMGSYVVNNKNGSDSMATELDCVENGKLEEFLSEWKNLYDEGGVENRSLSTNQFVSGEVAVFTSSSSNVSSVLEKVGDRFTVGTSQFIRVNDEAEYGATVSGSCLVMFESQDELRKKASWEFIKYLTGKEVQAEFAVSTGYIPSNLEALESQEYKAKLEENPQYRVAPEQLLSTPKEMKSVTVGPSADFYYAIMNGVSDMLKNNTDVKKATEEISSSLLSLLDQYRRNNI